VVAILTRTAKGLEELAILIREYFRKYDRARIEKLDGDIYVVKFWESKKVGWPRE